MVKIINKRCSRCGETKPANEFYLKGNTSDGLASHCKFCAQLCSYGRQVTSKRCYGCNMVKPAAEFGRNAGNNGLSAYCKACEKLRQTKNHKRQRVQIHHSPIQTWEQVDGLLRSMSELQYAIMVESQSLKERIAGLKSFAMKSIGAWHKQLTTQRAMIEGFLRCDYPEDYFDGKTFKFGSISYNKNGIDIKLKPKLAGERMGKP